MERCETCRFFLPYHDDPDDRSSIRGYGMCRRNPPVALPEGEISSHTLLDTGLSFPYTYRGQWCGEWRESNDATS